MDHLTGEISERFKRLKALTNQPDTSEALINAERTWHAFSETNAFTLREQGGTGPSPSTEMASLQPLRQARFRGEIAALEHKLETADRELEALGHHEASRPSALVPVSTVALALGILAMTVVIARSITAPMRALAGAIQRVAGGHLDERLELEGATDVRTIAVAFNSMTERLSRGLEQERQAAAAEARVQVERQRADELDRPRKRPRRPTGPRRVPGQHEPRDPHADERHHRHDRAGCSTPTLTPSSASTWTWSRRRPSRC